MPSIRLAHASFSFDSQRQLLADASLSLTNGWTGLVGANGAGKSTLLRILAGELPCEGVDVDGSVLRLEQRLERPTGLDAFASAWDKRALRLHSRLELQPLERWATLSPGERRRWQVGSALYAAPEILLLDEPCNHLDAASRAVLVRALRAFRGVGIVVSHDRELLDALTTRTARLQGGKLSVVDAAWTQASEVWEAQRQRQLAELEVASSQAKKARRQAVVARERLACSTRAKSLRHAAPRDHDARSSARKAALAKAEASHSAAASRAAQRSLRSAANYAAAERPPDLGREVKVAFTPAGRGVVCSLALPELSAGTTRLLEHSELTVSATDKIWIAGRNGAGKSTLLAEIVAATPLAAGRILHLPQELSVEESSGLLARLHALEPERRGAVLQVVAALGVPPAQLLRTQHPSPGEARKLALALGLADDRCLLVLDEPTHHLDLPSRERLQDALVRFEGALVLVTHDGQLGRDVCNRIIELSEHKLVERTLGASDGEVGGGLG